MQTPTELKCTSRLVLFALKADLGPRMTLLCGGEQWMRRCTTDAGAWLDSARGSTIDVGLEQICQMYERGQLVDPASKQRTLR